MVAVVGRSRQGDRRQVVDRSRTADVAHVVVVAEATHGVLVRGKVGRDRGVADRGQRQGGLGAQLGAGGVGPVDEVVAVVGRGRQGAVQEVLDRGGTAHGALLGAVHVDRHVVHVGVEDGAQAVVRSGVCRQGVVDGSGGVQVGEAGGEGSLLPFHEVVARGCGGLGVEAGAGRDEAEAAAGRIGVGQVIGQGAAEGHRAALFDALHQDDGYTLIHSEGVDHRVVEVGCVGLVDGVDVECTCGGVDMGAVALRHAQRTGGSIHDDTARGGRGALHTAVAYADAVRVVEGRSPVVEVNEGVAREGIGAPGQLGLGGVEVGRDGGVAHCTHRQGGRCAQLGAGGVGPVDEVVAVADRGGVGAALEVLHGGRTGHAAARGNVHIDRHIIYIGVEVGRDCRVAHRAHREGGVAAQHRAGGVGPVDEVVARVGCGRQGGALEVLHVARAADAAHQGGVQRGVDGVDVDREVGRQHAVAQGLHREGLLRALLHAGGVGPVDEVVARGGAGRQGYIGQVVHRGRAADATHGGVGALAADGVLVVVEVGVQHGVAHRAHRQGGGAAQLAAGLVGPVHEVVAVVGRGREGGAPEVLGRHGTAHRTHGVVQHVLRHVDGDVVHARVEHGAEGAVAVGVDGELKGVAGLGVVLVEPLHQAEARGGSGRQGDGQVELHRPGAAHGAPLGVAADAADLVLVAVVHGREARVLGQREADGVRVADAVARCVDPLVDMVAVDRRGRQADSAAVVVRARAGDGGQGGALVVAVAHRRDGVLVALAQHHAVDGRRRIAADRTIVVPVEDHLHRGVAGGSGDDELGLLPAALSVEGAQGGPSAVGCRCAGCHRRVLGCQVDAQVVVAAAVLSQALPVEVEGVLLGGLEVEEAVGVHVGVGTVIVGVGGAAVVADIEAAAVGGGAGGGAESPLVGLRAVGQHPFLVVAGLEGAAVGQVDGGQQGGEAHGLRPAAVALGAGAAHLHVVVVGRVGRQACQGGAAGGAGRHAGLVGLLAGLPVAEGVGRGGADALVGRGMQGGCGGADAVGGRQGGQAAAGGGGKLAQRPLAVAVGAAHRTQVEPVVGVARQTCQGGLDHVADGHLGGGLQLFGVQGSRADHILPAGLHAAGHPVDVGRRGGHVAHRQVGHIQTGVGILLIAELYLRQEVLHTASRA